MTADASAPVAETRAPRGERNEGRRGGGPRTEREPRPAPVADEAMPAAQPFVDTMPGATAEGAADSGERDASRRRRRRGGRGRGRDEGGAEGVANTAGDETQEREPGTEPTPIAADAVMHDAPYAEHVPEQPQRSEPVMTAVVAPVLPPPAMPMAVAPPPVPVVAAPVAPPPRQEPVPVPVAVAVATPAAAYQLPTESLASIASGAGLQWVGSDTEKMRAVQEAMANEPKPIHIPRQPKPRAVLDDGPLMLVETKKDLSQIKLPFDSSPPAAQ